MATLRKLTVTGSEGSKISTKHRELIMIAVEVATGRGEKGRSHARKAIRAGCTPSEVFEILTLCMYLVGISSWVDSGKDCLLSAVDEMEKMKDGEGLVWSSKVLADG
ncbi:MAG: carboxymuconolactone decarboxylase family protein [Nitrososphaerota archaeon]|nr:carboxymuconolactone decarboxylase family protein [Nitrososphaerota archaeon]